MCSGNTNMLEIMLLLLLLLLPVFLYIDIYFILLSCNDPTANKNHPSLNDRSPKSGHWTLAGEEGPFNFAAACDPATPRFVAASGCAGV